MSAIDRHSRIFVAGHRGMAGSALVRRLQSGGYTHVLTRTRSELDLLDQAATFAFLAAEQPDYVFIAAARAGGIWANNTYRADFLYENLASRTRSARSPASSCARTTTASTAGTTPA